jgi:hypothetical protein
MAGLADVVRFPDREYAGQAVERFPNARDLFSNE